MANIIGRIRTMQTISTCLAVGREKMRKKKRKRDGEERERERERKICARSEGKTAR
jgi:hypothetical protein